MKSTAFLVGWVDGITGCLSRDTVLGLGSSRCRAFRNRLIDRWQVRVGCRLRGMRCKRRSLCVFLSY